MKEVKIYTIVSDQLSPPITGESFCTDMVRHSDYAELDAKYAALAADNDKAMESLKQANAVVKLAHEKFSAMAAENTALKKSDVEFNEYCRRECEDVGDTWVDDFTETPATDAFLAEVRASAIPEGYALVPQQIFLEPSDIELICSQCGDGHESGYGDFTDGLLWVGNIQRDDGSIVHGLHISSADYTEEGGVTVCEFAAQPRKGGAV
ncbi:hypothetical protein Q1F44_001625 [Salmonella enterica]|uniref:Ead/Ea22-like family protein n=1 Tax=Salmonella enterica TaxID=28901 RepID=A0A613GK12_SALER|nr:hypothetical protein [Salmonella enterica]EAW4930620.1 hypothetical protein [Salmonella enterica subsp. enterica]EBH9667539.1 hypothetical protein [Salmonella enterica subsp. enterica serovar 4,[5],12:i:-]EBL2450807.1 hypothetical protein [Salmonella enterica subsp. enterica serovar Alachua]EBM9423103.1 hypothetical protein [Salmonella enterica subsp. enterica serovar Montevideo]EBV7225887.1 hypothetical protein [Salmonella enterica subsp. enterica serovar Livingstone]ECB2016851.1 hypothet